MTIQNLIGTPLYDIILGYLCVYILVFISYNNKNWRKMLI